MSDIFEKMMSKSGSGVSASPSPSSSGGRPMHDHWEGFAKVYVKGKVAAKCHLCSKTLLNSCKTRLIAHR